MAQRRHNNIRLVVFKKFKFGRSRDVCATWICTVRSRVNNARVFCPLTSYKLMSILSARELTWILSAHELTLEYTVLIAYIGSIVLCEL